jgi:hypothetical protein
MPRERATGRDGQTGIDLGFRTPLVVPPPVADTGHEQPFPVDASAPFSGEGARDPQGLFPAQPTRGRGPTIYGRK